MEARDLALGNHQARLDKFPDGSYVVEADEIGQDWKVKKTFRVDCGATEAAVAASMLTPVQMPPKSSPTVCRCVMDIELNKKATLTCPSCGQHEWRYAQFRGDPLVTCTHDVGESMVRCLKPQDGATFGNLRSACAHEGQLNDFIPKYQHAMLRKDVKNWMFTQAYIEPAYKPQFEDTRCEADKPIGTRDPDKFLKEQQDKLWREW